MSKGQRHGGGHMGGMRAGEKAKDFKGTMKETPEIYECV